MTSTIQQQIAFLKTLEQTQEIKLLIQTKQQELDD